MGSRETRPGVGNERLVKIEDGVYARRYASGRAVIMLQFAFRGVRCREHLQLDPANKTHIKQARYKIGAIRDAIRNNRFNYREFFPDSKRVAVFDGPMKLRTLREIGEIWLKDVAKSKPHSTYEAYEYPLSRIIFPAIGDKCIRDVTAEDIRSIFRSRDISLKTAKNYATPLKAIFLRAMSDEDVDKNVMDRINLKELIATEKQRSDYEIDPLDAEEINKFLKACAKHRPEWLAYWTVAFYTGLRTSELMGLEWGDIAGDTLYVARAQVKGETKDTKTTSSTRAVDLAPAVVDALRAHRKVTGLNTRVFWNPNSRGKLSYKVAQAAFTYICGKAGIKRRQAYQTRHSFASNMLSLGENPMYVAAQMGHKNTAMVFRRYAKWVSAEKYVRKSDFGATQIATSVPRGKPENCK